MGVLQPELFGNGPESCKTSPLPTVSQGEAVTAGAAFALDTLPCGQSKETDGLLLFSGGVSQNAKSLKQTSGNFQTNSSPLSLFRRFISSERLAPIFQLLELEPGLQDLVEACFIRDSDCFDYSKFRTLSLRMSKELLAAAPTQLHITQLELFSVTKPEDGAFPSRHVRSRSQLRNSIKARISSASSGSLGKWGMTAHGSSAMDIAGCHKTAPEFSLLVVTGNVQCRKIEPDRPTLQSCLDDGEIIVNQSPSSSSTCEDSAPSEKASAVQKKAVVYRSATGDRLYTEESPTLRSLANTGGKHQGGSGAWKVVEHKGEEYLVESGGGSQSCTLDCSGQFTTNRKRPISIKTGKRKDLPISYRGNPRPLTATEFERLMGWPTGSTEKGITPDGKEIIISKTQRQKMLGNGIIPHEIEDICNKLKPFIASSDPDSQPKPRSGS